MLANERRSPAGRICDYCLLKALAAAEGDQLGAAKKLRLSPRSSSSGWPPSAPPTGSGWASGWPTSTRGARSSSATSWWRPTCPGPTGRPWLWPPAAPLARSRRAAAAGAAGAGRPGRVARAAAAGDSRALLGRGSVAPRWTRSATPPARVCVPSGPRWSAWTP